MHCLHPLMLLGALVPLAACARQQPLAAPAADTEPEPLLPELVRSARSIEQLWAQLASQQTAPKQDWTESRADARMLHAAQNPQAALPEHRPEHHPEHRQGLNKAPEQDWTEGRLDAHTLHAALPQPRPEYRPGHQPQHRQGLDEAPEQGWAEGRADARTLHAAHEAQTALPQPRPEHRPGYHPQPRQEYRPEHRQGQDEAPDLQRRINLDWTGELRSLLRRMADLLQYSLHEFGPRPSLPIHISLHLENVTIAEALREAGLQAGRRAGVRVHGGARRRMELIYAK